MTETSPVPVLDDLSAREKELVAAARRGEVLVCSDLDTESLAASDDPAHIIRAELIRELLLGRHGELDPRGIQLFGARITRELNLDFVESPTGIRLVGCFFAEAISAYQAHLPELGLPECRLQSLHADGAHIAGALSLDNARLNGSNNHGVVRLLDARIGQFILNNAIITNDSGAAVSAGRIQTDSDIRLDHARLSGVGEEGTLRLEGARISSQLDLEDAVITNDHGPTVSLEDTTVSGTAFINTAIICPKPTRNSSCTHRTKVSLDGFTFGDLTLIRWWEWLHIIRCHTRKYKPQPYQQLAAAERASGHDNNARRILIAQQQDLYKRAPEALGGWWNRRFHSLWGLLAGYGYRARRTAVALLLALVIAGSLGFWAGQVTTDGNHHAAERTASFTNEDGERCSPVELIGVGLDRGLPLSPTGVRARCDLNTGTTWGQVFTVSIWLVQAAIWGLATLALAGYTSLIRKTA